MSFRNRLLLPTVGFALAVLAGCGGGTHSPVAPPSGSFSNTSLNGTYTFSVAGTDINAASNFGFFALSGSFTACGCSAGTISAGTVDLADLTGDAVAASLTTNTSGYSITQDGRGQVSLNISTSSGNIPVLLDLVLTSSSHGLVARFDSGGSGSGTIDIQSGSLSQSSLATSYAFSFSGSDLSGNSLATAGAFTLDSTGNILTSGSVAGVEDFNRFITSTMTPSPAGNLALSGFVHLGSGTTPGTATLSTSFGTFGFSVYAVDNTHLKFIENDGAAVLTGDAFTQSSSAFPSGNLIFTIAGPDPGGAPFAAGGVVTSDGTSTLSSGAEDYNDDGSIDNNTNPAAPQAFSGTFAAAGGGRYLVTMSGFVGGTAFAAYPSDGGLLLLEMDGSGLNSAITSGTAVTQASAGSLTASQGYAMNLTGADLVNFTQLDEIAQFNTTSSGLSGLLDENDFAVSNPGTGNLSGTYTQASGGLGSASFNLGLAEIFYYSIDNSNFLFLSVDPSVVAIGALQNQTSSSAGMAAETTQRSLSVVRTSVRRNTAKRQQRFQAAR